MRMIVLIYLIFFTYNAHPITEEELKESVLNHFPLIEESILKYDSSKAETDAANGAFDHKIIFKSRNRIEDKYENQYFETTIERQTSLGGLGLVLGHRQGTGRFPFYDGKYSTSSAGEIFAGISLPLLRNFQTDEFRTELEIARINENIAKTEVELKKNIYLHKALSLYYKWLMAHQKRRIREDMLKISIDRIEMLKKKFDAGDIEKLKLTDGERSVEKRNSELTEAKIELQDLELELGLYLRDKNGHTKRPTLSVLPGPILKASSLPIFDSDSLPQIKIIQSHLKMLGFTRKLHEQSKLPGLNFELIGSKELSPGQPYDPESLQVGVKFDYPLENRKAEGKTISSEYKIRAIEKQQSYIQQELKRYFDFSKEAQELTKERWEFTNNEYIRSMSLAKGERLRWQQGASDLYIVNLREQDAADSEIKRWKIWQEYHQYILDTHLYAGKILYQ